jgi:BirA family biotin operon repressor/biotin-[acetyl-CoA-carboxylase] ligase
LSISVNFKICYINNKQFYIFAKSNTLLSTHQPSIKLGHPFIQLLTVDSTNNYAFNLLKDNLAVDGTAIFAAEQSDGRGQMGKIWKANPNENIILSIIVDISAVYLQNQFGLLAMAALGCYDFFDKYAISETAIKWSNDIYWKDKKAGGILIETTQHQQKRFAIVGIGININQVQFDESLPNPVSLKQITGKHYNIADLAIELCESINNWYQILLQNNYALLQETYNKYLYKKDQEVKLRKGNINFNCTIRGVNDYGELVVDTGITECFKYGQIEWLNQ